MQKVAVFDIGSNAIRMVVAQYPLDRAEQGYEIVNRHRIPFRLGHDAFTAGKFSEKTLKRARQIFKGMVVLAKKEGATRLDAVATAAMREASNGKELIQDIKEKCQLNIRIISGEQEAYYLYSAVRHHSKNTYGAMALIDIGGGSTEISIAQDDKLIISKSFPIGTIRIMEASSQKALHQIIEQYQKGVEQLKVAAMPLLKSGKSLPMVGTGGNLRRFGKLRPHFFRSDETNSITLPELLFMQQELRKYTAKEIQKKYSLKRDRSQTIRPAMSLAISAMDMLGAKRLELPNFGLADGVILQMQST